MIEKSSQSCESLVLAYKECNGTVLATVTTVWNTVETGDMNVAGILNLATGLNFHLRAYPVWTKNGLKLSG